MSVTETWEGGGGGWREEERGGGAGTGEGEGERGREGGGERDILVYYHNFVVRKSKIKRPLQSKNL